MARVTFEQLLTLYRHIDFASVPDEGVLFIESEEVLAALHAAEADDEAAEEANLASMVAPSDVAVGQKVEVRVSAPRIGLGLLVRAFDDLLAAPEARIAEPRAYFVIDGRLERRADPAPDILTRYRRTLEVVSLFADAASYLDKTRQELVFFRDGKFSIPIRYSSEDLHRLDLSEVAALLGDFRDDVHKEQKLAILAEALAHVCESQPLNKRFSYLLANLDVISEEVRTGYKLFASSFSYSKIRNEIEAARVEYIGKIHKTLIDIQGQLLGIPIATIVVASQLKSAPGCGVEFWTNVAVLGGAWIFVALLFVSIVNQWLTLDAIASEIAGQKRKLSQDFAAIADQFVNTFDGLTGRICWHRAALAIVGILALAGAIFASIAYDRLSSVDFGRCLTPSAAAPTAAPHLAARATDTRPKASSPNNGGKDDLVAQASSPSAGTHTHSEHAGPQASQESASRSGTRPPH